MLETFKIVFHPNEILRKKDLQDVKWVEAQHISDAKKMLETMYNAKGVGLSSPQVALPYRLVVMDHNGKTPKILFNPFVLEKSPTKINKAEGCLSFPKLSKIVKRSSSIIVRYRGIDNIIKVEEFSELEARIILHEIDHLNGSLFTDR